MKNNMRVPGFDDAESIIGDYRVKSPDEIRKDQEDAKLAAEKAARDKIAKQKAIEYAKAAAEERDRRKKEEMEEKERMQRQMIIRYRIADVLRGTIPVLWMVGCGYFAVKWVIGDFEFVNALKWIGYTTFFCFLSYFACIKWGGLDE